jgi:hypothetical protein
VAAAGQGEPDRRRKSLGGKEVAFSSRRPTSTRQWGARPLASIALNPLLGARPGQRSVAAEVVARFPLLPECWALVHAVDEGRMTATEKCGGLAARRHLAWGRR